MKPKIDNPSGVLTNSDLDKIAKIMDKRIAPLATKAELKEEIANLKVHIDEGIESVMGGMDTLYDELTGKQSRPWLTRE